MEDHRCEGCGQPASVSVLAGYVQGKPVTRRFCLSCADRQRAVFDRIGSNPGDSHLAIPSLMVASGLLIGGSVLVFDFAGIGGESGFGWHQQAALVVGALLILIAALLRIDLIGLVGTILLILAACGDFLGLGGSPASGLPHSLLIGGAAVLAAGGLILRRRQRRSQQGLAA